MEIWFVVQSSSSKKFIAAIVKSELRPLANLMAVRGAVVQRSMTIAEQLRNEPLAAAIVLKPPAFCEADRGAVKSQSAAGSPQRC